MDRRHQRIFVVRGEKPSSPADFHRRRRTSIAAGGFPSSGDGGPSSLEDFHRLETADRRRQRISIAASAFPPSREMERRRGRKNKKGATRR
jgi:hypothetical protein